MKDFSEIKGHIDSNWDKQIQTLKELITIQSVEGEATEEQPFGEYVQEALEYFLKKGQELGFSPKNIDNWGGHLAYNKNTSPETIRNDPSHKEDNIYLEDIYETDKIDDTAHREKSVAENPTSKNVEDDDYDDLGDEIFGVVCHLDVVPAGGQWDFPPFEGIINEGRLYGRGAIDNKGPAVASLFAMKALLDSGFVPKREIRLILGLDEETNWTGMDYYLKNEAAPDLGFTPDGDFPAIHGEKGILVFDLAKKINKTHNKGWVLRSFKGGQAANMVADFARVIIKEDKKTGKKPNYEPIIKIVDDFKQKGISNINTRIMGQSLEITAKGVSAHGARPELGINAISKMMKTLGEISFNNDEVNEFISFFNKHIGEETTGESLGIAIEDKPSGKTIVNVGKIEIDGKAARLTINVRYPVTAKAKDIYGGLEQVCNKYQLGIVKGKHQQPIYVPATDGLITTLMDSYREHTFDLDSKPLVIGGGTYARAFENIVAFGSRFPGEEECAHQKNEYIDLEKFRLMTYIFADAIYRLNS